MTTTTDADTATGQMPDYWSAREPGEPPGIFVVRLAAGYLRAKASADLDRAASRISLATALDPRNTGGQDPHPRYGRADYDTDEEVTRLCPDSYRSTTRIPANRWKSPSGKPRPA